jgi:signal transduction histidine kinase
VKTTHGPVRPVLTDASVAVLCVLVFWLPLDNRPTAIHIGLIGSLFVGLLARSRWPVAAFWLVAVSTFAGALLGVTHDPFVAAAWALYPVAVARRGVRSSRAISGALGAVIVALMFVGGTGFGDTVRYALLSMLALAGAWSLGTARWRERAETEHAALAERDRAVVTERLRVVREVHDVVSHSLGTIAVTAGVGAHVGSDDAEPMRRKLAQIEETSKQALAELRTVLGAIRDRGETATRTPQPTIADLPDLAGRAERAGVRVRLTVTGVDDVSANAELAVYRIVREGLTNTTRHAPGARCDVTVSGTRQAIRVELVNDAGAGNGGGGEGGFGLLGLRERVELLGGELTAGHLPEGGFALRAVIPTSETRDG